MCLAGAVVDTCHYLTPWETIGVIFLKGDGMSTNTTLAGILFSRIDTRDPLIAQWAIDRIIDLRKRSKAAADEASRALFVEATTRKADQLYENGRFDTSRIRWDA